MHGIEKSGSRDELENTGWPSFDESLWPTRTNFMDFVRSDTAANRRDPKSQVVMCFFRVCQIVMGGPQSPRKTSLPLVAVYRLLTEWLLGLELRPRTVVGKGLSIYHGYGLVVNDHCILGEGVRLRNGVTIGHKRPGGDVPVLADGVEVGANAVILGGITVGSNAMVGAGAVVTRDVPAESIARGNPADITSQSGS